MSNEEIMEILDRMKEQLFPLGFSIVFTMCKVGSSFKIKHIDGKIFYIEEDYVSIGEEGYSGSKKLNCINPAKNTLDKMSNIDGYPFLSLEDTLLEIIEVYQKRKYFL